MLEILKGTLIDAQSLLHNASEIYDMDITFLIAQGTNLIVLEIILEKPLVKTN